MPISTDVLDDIANVFDVPADLIVDLTGKKDFTCKDGRTFSPSDCTSELPHILYQECPNCGKIFFRSK